MYSLQCLFVHRLSLVYVSSRLQAQWCVRPAVRRGGFLEWCQCDLSCTSLQCFNFELVWVTKDQEERASCCSKRWLTHWKVEFCGTF